jgi:hypothetical protein
MTTRFATLLMTLLSGFFRPLRATPFHPIPAASTLTSTLRLSDFRPPPASKFNYPLALLSLNRPATLHTPHILKTLL